MRALLAGSRRINRLQTAVRKSALQGTFAWTGRDEGGEGGEVEWHTMSRAQAPLPRHPPSPSPKFLPVPSEFGLSRQALGVSPGFRLLSTRGVRNYVEFSAVHTSTALCNRPINARRFSTWSSSPASVGRRVQDQVGHCQIRRVQAPTQHRDECKHRALPRHHLIRMYQQRRPDNLVRTARR